MRQTVVLLALSLAACAETTTIPLAQDTFRITARGDQYCGSSGAEKVAVQQAAVEVIKRGYDRYVILGAQSQSSVVGSRPVTVQPGLGGGALVSGGDPIVASREGLVVRMFRDNDPAAANALSARATLGPNWQEIAAKTTMFCF